jgi:hypothetical protein
MGFRAAQALRGGIAAWRAAGHPVEPIAAAPHLVFSTTPAPR